MTDKNVALVPEEGWHCLHLFYRIEYGQWQLLSREEQNAAKTNLASLVQEIRAMESTQLLTLSMVTPKADIAFMLITPDLHSANRIEKQLSLSLDAELMKGHAAVGREFAGKVKQLITGSTGLDDAEWGVTLFARDTFQIKAIVYQMRFDPVSAEYADFGEFYIGIQLPLDELFRRLQL